MAAQSPGQTLAFAVATGAVSMIPLWRAPRRVRTALVSGSTLAAGAGAFVALRRPDLIDVSRGASSTPVALGVGAAAAGVAGGAMAVGLLADRWLEQFLVRRGVRRPRLVIGVGSAALSYAIDVIDRAVDSD